MAGVSAEAVGLVGVEVVVVGEAEGLALGAKPLAMAPMVQLIWNCAARWRPTPQQAHPHQFGRALGMAHLQGLL